MTKVLITWLGMSDVKAMQGPAAGLKDDPGPVLRLLRREAFDAVHLINDLPNGGQYPDWVRGQLEYKPVVKIHTEEPLRNQYQRAYDVTRRRILEALEEQGANAEYTLLLSPGQPAAQLAMLVAHEAIFRRNARMVNVDRQAGVEEVRLRLAVEILPEPVRRAAAGVEPGPAFAGILGKSEALAHAKREAQLFAPYSRPGQCIHLLLLGESGTGKELFAKAIHDASTRAGQRFVVLNCGAVVGTLAESELFGHVRGAFTGADKDRDGAAKMAHGGTLFLDEVGDMPKDLQVKLLRFLNDGSYRPVGTVKEEKADVRVVAATHRDLPDLVRRGELRGDLYERLNGKTIQLPPLRHRREDIDELAADALERFNGAYDLRCKFGPGALDALRQAPWPGNVRQLVQAVRRLAASAEGGVITAEDVAAEAASGVAFPERGARPLAELTGGEVLTRLAACLEEVLDRWVEGKGLPVRRADGEGLIARLIDPLLWGRAVHLAGNLTQAGTLIHKSKGDRSKHQKHLDAYEGLRHWLDEADIGRQRRG
jgi:transcriptional regulator with PAS, ATPase and Fis domain